MIDYKMKCKKCSQLNLNRGQDYWCNECNGLCKDNWEHCSNQLIVCEMCKHHSEKEKNYCSIDRHFKAKHIFRICRHFIKK